MKLSLGIGLALLLALVGFASPAAAQGGKDKKDKPAIDGLKALTHPDLTVRYNSADLLAQLGPTAKFAIPALREALTQDKSMAVRVKIAEALWKVERPAASVVLPTLLLALKDKESLTRVAAAAMIGFIGPKAKNAVTALSTALKDEDLSVRSEAAAALGEIGSAAKDAVPALLAMTGQDDYEFIEPVIAITLGKLGPVAVPALSESLTSKDVKRRRTAAAALGLIGPPAAAAVPGLTEAVKDGEASVRQCAVQALGQMGQEAKAALDELSRAMKDKDDAVRVAAAVALWQVAKWSEGTGVLVEVLQGKSFLRERAARALGEFGPGAVQAVPALAAVLADKDERVRAAAAEALGRLPTPKTEAAKLFPLLEDDAVQVRLSAAQALWTLAPAVQAKALPVLTKELTHKNAQVRLRVATLLGQNGGDAKAAVPALTQALLDQNPQVRQAVGEALKKIDPDAAAKMGIP